ncbi:DUF802 domain-containing protein [Alloalcanivorax xenomutans]|uniref:DUF802 domain-containing protein n=1 Tax=Alloalcanivorax xenomutans TaxID=1094342 RepID=A0A9Q3ZCW9_9GAMM|nr:DUF802 domain-containing protein [Alloalcanivorax xenomutans]ARB44283.1 hypothetical protein P40_01665 [Alloalcanivorax xenomutans]MCE7508830.1 DUF802 domain-containing protein [Alloalcanivorax xenomutans]
MTRFLFALTFILGAITVIWVGLGFLGTDLVALTATLLIALVYGLGFLELRQFRRATDQMRQSLGQLPGSPESLSQWLAGLPASLRGTVRRRVEGEPAALPGPMLTPYLSGLLVMLGLLGTFIGMIVTLRGAVTALEGGSELHAIRNALAAPISGMSLAFGTSIAGVASSAMLGLAAALSRRDRIVAGRELDGHIATELRAFSIGQQQRDTYQALREQSAAFPEVVAQLGHLAERMEHMSEQVSGALTQNQQQFHDNVSGHYQQLARSVSETLKQSLADSGRIAAESTRPIVEVAMARLGQQAESTHQALSEISERQLGALAERFQSTTEQAALHWRQGLAEQQQTSAKLAADIDAALKAHNSRFEQHSSELLAQTREHHQQLRETGKQQLSELAEHFQATTEQAARVWQSGLGEQQQHSRQLTEQVAEALRAHSERFREQSELLLAQAKEHHQHLQRAGETQLTALAERFQTTTEQAAELWRDGLNQQQQTNAHLAETLGATLKDHNDTFHQHSTALLEQTREHHQQLQNTGEQQLATLAERFQATTEQTAEHWRHGLNQQQRSAAGLIENITQTLQSHNAQFQNAAETLIAQQRGGLEKLIADTGEALSALRDEEARRGETATARLAELETTVTRHLGDLGAALEAPMTRLIETASETPKAAAEVISQLREEMARGSERDNEMLEERRRIMAELETLLAAQRETAAAQREAVESLIRDSGDILKTVSDAFSQQVDEQSRKLDEVTSDVTGGAHEVASLSEAFSVAVQLFSDANDKLVDHLQRVETALEQATARSDEQLAYYVEQAREVIDLSMTSQKDVLEALGAVRQQSATNGNGAG